MRHPRCLVLALAALAAVPPTAAAGLFSRATQTPAYGGLLDAADGIKYADLPGFTRSVYRPRDYALTTPESRTWAGAAGAGWVNASTAHVVSPSIGAKFSMALARVGAAGAVGPAPPGIDRVVFVLDGDVSVDFGGGKPPATLHGDGFAFVPAETAAATTLTSAAGAALLLYEARAPGEDAGGGGSFSSSSRTPFAKPSASALPLVDPGGGEIFRLRKLLPPAAAAFNVHVMDFEAGEYLVTKEAHHNEHGLLLLEGRGVYRLGSEFYAVTAGDAIWMAPYTLQWFGALGPGRSRYIIYKDTPADAVLV